MTRRERLEAKLEKRQEWAGKAEARAEQRFNTAQRIGDMIPFGQPILVGHHSERHHRRDLDRIDSNMRAGVAEAKLAEHHDQKAAGLAAQLDRSIFSDDDNAIEALGARIAEREAEAARMVAMNKAWRTSKGDPAKFAELAGITEAQAQGIAHRIEGAYSWEKQPHPSWELSNLRGNINRDKKRLEEVKVRQERAEKAEVNGGVTIEGTDYVSVTFAEKPDRSVLDALKAAGFRWSQGSWHGRRDKLPDLS